MGDKSTRARTPRHHHRWTGRAVLCAAALAVAVGTPGCASTLASGAVEPKTSLLLFIPEVVGGTAFAFYHAGRCPKPDAAREPDTAHEAPPEQPLAQPGDPPAGPSVVFEPPPPPRKRCRSLPRRLLISGYSILVLDAVTAMIILSYRGFERIDEREQARQP